MLLDKRYMIMTRIHYIISTLIRTMCDTWNVNCYRCISDFYSVDIIV